MAGAKQSCRPAWRLLDLGDRAQHLRRDLLVQLHVVLELETERASASTRRRRLPPSSMRTALCLEEVVAVGVARSPRAPRPPPAPSRCRRAASAAAARWRPCRHRRSASGRIVVGGVLLGGQQDLLVVAHHLFKRAHRLLAPHEQRHDHVREHHDIAQRQDGIRGRHRCRAAGPCLRPPPEMTTSSTPSSPAGRTWCRAGCLHDRAQATSAGLALDRLRAIARSASSVKVRLDVFHLEQPLILLDQRVLRLGQDLDQRFLVEVFQRRDHRQTADEFRNQAELQQIFRLDLAQEFADRRSSALEPPRRKPIEVPCPRRR
jgi:hypothetical protein